MNNIKLICGVITIISAIGGYVLWQEARYAKASELAASNENHASAKELEVERRARVKLAADFEYDKNKRRYNFLDEWLDRKDQRYGDNCSRCDPDTRRDYRRKKAEWRLLEKKL
jgi:hypothetical protein